MKIIKQGAVYLARHGSLNAVGDTLTGAQNEVFKLIIKGLKAPTEGNKMYTQKELEKIYDGTCFESMRAGEHSPFNAELITCNAPYVYGQNITVVKCLERDIYILQHTTYKNCEYAYKYFVITEEQAAHIENILFDPYDSASYMQELIEYFHSNINHDRG